MDKLIKLRTPIRAIVTKTVREINEEFNKEEIDNLEIRLKNKKLEECLAILQEKDEKILEFIINAGDQYTEEEYTLENEIIEEYRDKIRRSLLKIEDYFSCRVVAQGLQGPPSVRSSESSTLKKTIYKLPKIELKKFGDDVKEWLSWWSQFKKIHEDEDLDASDKFQYLVQSMVRGSRAKDVVESYPMTVENYPKAIKALKNRFGREEMLIEVYVRELQKLVIQNVTSNEKLNISKMFDKLESHLRALESLGVTSENYAAMLYPMVESSLPEEVLRAWKRSPMSIQNMIVPFVVDGAQPKTKLDFMMDFLRSEVESEESIAIAKSGFGISSQKRKDNSTYRLVDSNIPTATELLTGQSLKCVFCSGEHFNFECKSASSMSLELKREKLKSKRCCFTCTRPGHSFKECKSKFQCTNCNARHATVMCTKISTNSNTPNQSVQSTSAGIAVQSYTRDVFLQVLLVNVKIGLNLRRIRIVFDCGSHKSYIKSNLTREIGLEPTGELYLQKNLFGGGGIELQRHSTYNLQLFDLDNRNSQIIEVLNEKQICAPISKVQRGAWIEELEQRRIHLSDLDSETSDIEVLIGNDYYGSFLTGNVIQLNCGLTVIETIFGWTLSGKVIMSQNTNSAMLITSLFVNNFNITDLWKLELIGITDPIEQQSKSIKEQKTMQNFLDTVSRDSNGRYCVELPWIQSDNIPDNKDIALQRLKSTTNKLKKIGQFENYDKVFKSWSDEGIIEIVPESELQDIGHYIPHKAVLKLESKTTPIRPVFDASCKVGRVPSLNECLQKGPNLLELIPAILLRYREGNIGVTSDIRKAFLQIMVVSKDQNYQCFYWWKDLDMKEVIVFRHKMVMFGINASPFLLAAVIKYHLSRVPATDKIIAEKLEKALYVDNCVTSVNSNDELKLFQSKSTKLMADACMDLRQWESSIQIDDNSKNITNVLGLKWNKLDDSLSLDLNVETPQRITMRTILSSVQKIYDPLGFFSPVTLLPKIIIQRSFFEKKGWDDNLDELTQSEFIRWLQELKFLDEIWIPRNITGKVIDRSNWQLHVFCDASGKAYTGVIFLRTKLNGKVNLTLVQSKARIAPKFTKSIPRLELMGCTIGSRLLKGIQDSLQLDIPIFMWSDSTVALAWIRRNDEWGTFVGNRIKEILILTKVEHWRYVPGEMNPADLPSRGCSPKQLLKSKWWEGPRWLLEDEETWPNYEDPVNESDVNAERKKIVSTTLLATNKPLWYLPSTSYIENVKALAWAKRLFQIFRKEEISSSALTVLEIENAESDLWKRVQTESFTTEDTVIEGIRVLRTNGLIRVKTKLLYRDDSYSFRLPVLLPHSHPLVDQLIKEVHKKNGHCSIQILMSILRERFWIIRSRQAIKNILANCVNCLRFTAKPCKVVPAPLPEDRIKDAKVFEVVGVDLTGRFILKDKSLVYVVIFTCAVFRCVHLELVSSCETDVFLEALERFINKCGRPSIIYSDNGKTFVGANNWFNKLDWDRIVREMAIKKIVWKFNPPTAAWWGGWWEILIRLMKDLMKRILGRQRLNYEELLTCVSHVQALMNSRPLTYVTEDSEDFIPLTPSHFLQDISEIRMPEITLNSADGLRKRYQYQMELKKQLKSRFRKEYLGALIQKGNNGKIREVKVGEIVLVGTDNQKRILWPMARVIEELPGQDGHLRLVRLATSKNGVPKTMLRPLQRLYPLEVSS